MKAQAEKSDCIENAHTLGLLAWMELFSYGMYPANGSNPQSTEDSSTIEDAKRTKVKLHVF